MRKWLCLVSMWSIVVAVPAMSSAQGKEAALRTVEIRSYNLKPGTRDRFHQLFLKEALPMLQRWQVDVVGYGPSLHDADSYFLMRAYSSPAERERSEDAFYGSDEWRQGPREALLALIENYTSIVINADEKMLQALRGLETTAGSA